MKDKLQEVLDSFTQEFNLLPTAHEFPEKLRGKWVKIIINTKSNLLEKLLNEWDNRLKAMSQYDFSKPSFMLSKDVNYVAAIKGNHGMIETLEKISFKISYEVENLEIEADFLQHNFDAQNYPILYIKILFAMLFIGFLAVFFTLIKKIQKK